MAGEPETPELCEKTLTRAKNAAYRCLAGRPRSRRELAEKLHEKEFPGPVVDAVIAYLERLGYINDAKFADQWARSRVLTRGFGKRRLEQELRDRGIDRGIIRETLSRLLEDSPEADVALKEALKKLKTLARFSPQVRRRRLAGFLERKGFSFEIIRSVLKESV